MSGPSFVGRISGMRFLRAFRLLTDIGVQSALLRAGIMKVEKQSTWIWQ